MRNVVPTRPGTWKSMIWWPAGRGGMLEYNQQQKLHFVSVCIFVLSHYPQFPEARLYSRKPVTQVNHSHPTSFWLVGPEPVLMNNQINQTPPPPLTGLCLIQDPLCYPIACSWTFSPCQLSPATPADYIGKAPSHTSWKNKRKHNSHQLEY